MNKTILLRFVFLAFIITLLATSCDSDYSGTGRGLIYTVGLIVGFLVDRAIARLKQQEESLLGIICGILTIGVFALAATYIPDELAQTIGILTMIIGTIGMLVYLTKAGKR